MQENMVVAFGGYAAQSPRDGPDLAEDRAAQLYRHGSLRLAADDTPRVRLSRHRVIQVDHWLPTWTFPRRTWFCLHRKCMGRPDVTLAVLDRPRVMVYL